MPSGRFPPLGLSIYSEVTGEQPAAGVHRVKTPEKRSAPVYSGCSQHPKTHRSATHVGFHTHPKQSISGAVPAQEAFSLCPGTTLSGLLLVDHGIDSRSGQRDAQGAPHVPAVHAEILDDVADDAVGPMGCGGPGV